MEKKFHEFTEFRESSLLLLSCLLSGNILVPSHKRLQAQIIFLFFYSANSVKHLGKTQMITQHFDFSSLLILLTVHISDILAHNTRIECGFIRHK